MTQVDLKFSLSWKRLHFRRRLALILWAAWIPYVIILSSMLRLFKVRPNEKLLVLMIGGWFGFFVFSIVLLNEFRCPNCGQRFHVSRRWIANAFTKKCLNCGQKIYGQPEEI